jgi:3-hydroxyacyl-CoA dehydrogenase
MRAGFGWENGPFEIWDAVGVQKGIELAKEAGYRSFRLGEKCRNFL